MFTRRLMLAGAGVVAAAAAFRWVPEAGAGDAGPPENFPLTRTDAEWRARLSPDQYAILRRSSTERPFTSPLNDEHRRGTFSCAGCEQAAFASDTKFDSGTGWPSFWQPLEHAVRRRDDRAFGMTRSEVHCSRCGGHFGHVFDDGPQPTGLRYCMNGVALVFAPTAA